MHGSTLWGTFKYRLATDIFERVTWFFALVTKPEAKLLLFNGIWRTAPDIGAKILAPAKCRNVVVAADFVDAMPQLSSRPGTTTSLIQVNWVDTKQQRLQVRIQNGPKR